MVRPELPQVPGAALGKQAVLNNSWMVGLLIAPLQTRFGNQLPDPEKERFWPPHVGLNAMPLSTVRSVRAR